MWDFFTQLYIIFQIHAFLDLLFVIIYDSVIYGRLCLHVYKLKNRLQHLHYRYIGKTKIIFFTINFFLYQVNTTTTNNNNISYCLFFIRPKETFSRIMFWHLSTVRLSAICPPLAKYCPIIYFKLISPR